MTALDRLSAQAASDGAFVRYLAAKKTVDDRSLNGHVWNTLANALLPTTPERPLHVLEVGAGIGTMAERVVERRLFKHACYTLVDECANHVAEIRARLPRHICRHGTQIVLDPQLADALEFTARTENQGRWDLLIAHAFLDLLDLPSALPVLLGCLRRGGLYYFSIVFDGATIFQPEIDPVFDRHVEALYHRTMDQRITMGRPSGDSRAGRRLVEYLRRAGADVLAAGSSDWVVLAGPSGYPDDEAYFLHFIVNTIQAALHGHPELDGPGFDEWIAERHAQVERHELVYIAHQLDFVGRTRH